MRTHLFQIAPPVAAAQFAVVAQHVVDPTIHQPVLDGSAARHGVAEDHLGKYGWVSVRYMCMCMCV